MCGNELGKKCQNISKIVEPFSHGPLIRGVNKEFTSSKLPEAPNPLFEKLSGPLRGPDGSSGGGSGASGNFGKGEFLKYPAV